MLNTTFTPSWICTRLLEVRILTGTVIMEDISQIVSIPILSKSTVLNIGYTQSGTTKISKTVLSGYGSSLPLITKGTNGSLDTTR